MYISLLFGRISPLFISYPAISYHIPHNYINTPILQLNQYIMRGYYSEVFRNKENESLEECLEKYGTGSQSGDTKNGVRVRTHLIYLDDTRSAGCSWLFRIEKQTGRTFIPARLYRDDPTISIKVIENFRNYNGIQLGTVS